MRSARHKGFHADCRVYRLQLAHNQLSHIAYEFTGCSALRYLNLRDNRFRQVPKAVSR